MAKSAPGLYIHIPYCKRACPYCHFYKSTDPFPTREYIRALIAELREAGVRRFATLYVGGGSPSALGDDLLELVDEILARVEVEGEMSVEVNPEDASPSLFGALALRGIKRISLGVQSLSDGELQRLGRGHTAAQAIRAYELATRYFNLINIDLIFGIPGQSPDDWRRTLERVVALSPDSISTYELEAPAGWRKPDDLELALMYRMREWILEPAGYTWYEVSNWAKPGRECRHNLIYWRREDYLGLGPSAASLRGALRWKNLPSLTRYIRESPPPRRVEKLTKRQILVERIFLGIRTRRGVPLALVGRVPPELRGLVKVEGGRVKLTGEGILVADRVALALLP